MKRLRCCALLALAVLPMAASAEVFDLNISSEAFRASLSGPTSRLFSQTEGLYDVGGMLRSDHGENLTALHAGLLVTGDAGAKQANVTAGLGVRAQFTDFESQSGGGLAVGGQAEVRIPGYERLGFLAYIFFQPEVLSLGDIEQQTEYAATLDYKVLRQASIYAGYRELRLKTDDFGSFKADDGAIFGLRLQF